MNSQRRLAVLALLSSLSLFAGCRAGAAHNPALVLIPRKPLAVSAAVASTSSQMPDVTVASYQQKTPQTTPPDDDRPRTEKRSREPGVIEPIVAESIDLTNDQPFRLTLPDAISIALQNNPDLRAVRAGEPVAVGALGVARTYPYNPQFQTQVLPYSRDRDGNDGAVSQQHVLVQTFELGGQQQHREGVAAGTLGQVRRTINQAELMNIAQTSRLFFAAVYQRELSDLNRTLTELNETQIGVIERREKAGQANAADVALAKLQAQASRRQLRLSEVNYRTALLALRTQLNFDPNMPLDLSIGWETMGWEELDESYLQQLVSSRPDVMAARAAVAAAHANLRLADAMRCPNLQAGPMYQFDDASTVFWGVQAQIDIPVVNTGKPLVQQRYAELRQQQITAQQLENRALLEAQAAIRRYTRARQMIEDSRGDFERDMTEALKPFEDQFRAGQITLLQVFAARTAIAQSRQSYLDLLNEVSQAAVDVTQATGVPPQQLFSWESGSLQ